MLLSDFINAIQSLLLLRLKMTESDAFALTQRFSNKFELWFNEGYAPIEAVGEMIGRELSENFDVRTGNSILTQLVVDPVTGAPRVERVA